MPNVNMADLRASLKECVEYCREHDDRDYCERHRPILDEALEDLEESRRETDEYYTEWRAQHRSQRQAWKSLAQLLDEVQEELDRVNAVGYPDQTVRYWDEEFLEEIVEEMIEYLEERTDEIEIADRYVDQLRRDLSSANDEIEEQEKALRNYKRRVKKRSDAMAGAAQAIMDFRELLRDEIGMDHPDYEELRVPYALGEEAAM